MLLTVEQVSKRFNKTHLLPWGQRQAAPLILDNLSFECRAANVVAVLGCNGAGKSTLLRTLAGLLAPQTGKVMIDGLNMQQYKAICQRKIGFISDQSRLFHRLSVLENLRYFGRLYALSGAVIEQRISELAKQMQFEGFLHKPLAKCSTGMIQKANIARAILHQPAILILDEPTSGLDIQAAQIVLQTIEQQRQQGVLVLFSTHHLNEVERLADELLVVHAGKIAFRGQSDELLLTYEAATLEQAMLAIFSREAQQDV